MQKWIEPTNINLNKIRIQMKLWEETRCARFRKWMCTAKINNTRKNSLYTRWDYTGGNERFLKYEK